MKSRFKQLRQDAGLTQEEFRIQFNNKYHRNYTPSAISRFENDKRIPETMALMDFADFFGVTVDYLLGRDTDPLQKSLPDDSSTARVTQESIDLITPEEEDLLEDYRKLHKRDKKLIPKIISTILEDYNEEPSVVKDLVEEAIGIDVDEDFIFSMEPEPPTIKQQLANLEKNILRIAGLNCSEIKSVKVRPENIAHYLKLPLIADLLKEQEKDSITYLVPEMFHMEAFYDSLRNSLLHYSAAPEITIGNFKSKCQEFSRELRAFEYTNTMSASAEQLENYSSFTYLGIEYCRINNDIYRIEKDGPGRYILTKQARPTYDPTPKEKKKESTHYRYAA